MRSRVLVKWSLVNTLKPKTMVETVNATPPRTRILMTCDPAVNRSSPGGGSAMYGIGLCRFDMVLRAQLNGKNGQTRPTIESLRPYLHRKYVGLFLLYRSIVCT